MSAAQAIGARESGTEKVAANARVLELALAALGSTTGKRLEVGLIDGLLVDMEAYWFALDTFQVTENLDEQVNIVERFMDRLRLLRMLVATPADVERESA